jgi:hypothetical protein
VHDVQTENSKRYDMVYETGCLIIKRICRVSKIRKYLEENFPDSTGLGVSQRKGKIVKTYGERWAIRSLGGRAG